MNEISNPWSKADPATSTKVHETQVGYATFREKFEPCLILLHLHIWQGPPHAPVIICQTKVTPLEIAKQSLSMLNVVKCGKTYFKKRNVPLGLGYNWVYYILIISIISIFKVCDLLIGKRSDTLVILWVTFFLRAAPWKSGAIDAVAQCHADLGHSIPAVGIWLYWAVLSTGLPHSRPGKQGYFERVLHASGYNMSSAQLQVLTFPPVVGFCFTAKASSAVSHRFLHLDVNPA